MAAYLDRRAFVISGYIRSSTGENNQQVDAPVRSRFRQGWLPSRTRYASCLHTPGMVEHLRRLLLLPLLLLGPWFGFLPIHGGRAGSFRITPPLRAV